MAMLAQSKTIARIASPRTLTNNAFSLEDDAAQPSSGSVARRAFPIGADSAFAIITNHAHAIVAVALPEYIADKPGVRISD